MQIEDLSFKNLEKRLRGIPDGPSSVLDTPTWIFTWNLFGTLGFVAALLPSLLIHWLEPAQWLVGVARGGMWVALVGYFPGFIRNVWVVARSMWRWREDQPEQLDHDFAEFHRVASELAQHHRDALAERLRFIRLAQSRLTAKLGLLAGGFDRLGVIPILVGLGLQFRTYDDPLSLPAWQVGIGLFIGAAYLVTMLAALMRLRMQLYEVVLDEALSGNATGPGAED